jgi:hypothetical protein
VKKAHRWGPVIRSTEGGRLVTRCLKTTCDMDLSVEDVPDAEAGEASEFLRQMTHNADRTFSCPFKKPEVHNRIIPA